MNTKFAAFIMWLVAYEAQREYDDKVDPKIHLQIEELVNEPGAHEKLWHDWETFNDPRSVGIDPYNRVASLIHRVLAKSKIPLILIL